MNVLDGSSVFSFFFILLQIVPGFQKKHKKDGNE
jgi:hypothetical protein